MCGDDILVSELDSARMSEAHLINEVIVHSGIVANETWVAEATK